ncbi:MAG: SPOR domain-containing protein, partial [Chloroflexota bacterium]
RYDLPYAQTASSARFSGKNVTTTESARGSFAFGSGNGYVHADNRSATGRGAITVIPFLDINNNNIKEDNEPIAQGLSVRLNGGRIIKYDKDSLIRIIELEPYASYLLELDEVGFENIAWQLPIRTMSIQIDPNQFKKVGVPIKVKGEANGTVYVKKGRSLVGQGRIIINILDANGKTIMRMLTESDGYFNYLGLMPGKYTAQPDSAQLIRLGYTAEPTSLDFTINPSIMGDIIDDITFTLTPIIPVEQPEEAKPLKGESSDLSPDKKTSGMTSQKVQKAEDIKDLTVEKTKNESTIEVKDTKGIKTKEKAEETSGKKAENSNFNASEIKGFPGDWFVQAGAYMKLFHARNMQNRLTIMGYNAEIIRIQPYHKVRITGLESEKDARRIAFELSSVGIENFVGR